MYWILKICINSTNYGDPFSPGALAEMEVAQSFSDGDENGGKKKMQQLFVFIYLDGKVKGKKQAVHGRFLFLYVNV